MRRILDDLEIESPGQRLHPGHVPDLTAVMDRQYRHHLFAAGESLLDPPFRVGHVQVEVRFPAIHQQGCRVEIADDLGSRRESHRGNDRHVTRLQAGGLQGQMQRRRAAIQGHGMFLPEVTCELLLELFCSRPGRQPTGFQTVQHLVNLASSEAGAIKWNDHAARSR
jgi:hypothetical protein